MDSSQVLRFQVSQETQSVRSKGNGACGNNTGSLKHAEPTAMRCEDHLHAHKISTIVRP
jgi:hypothetical protein